MDHDDEWLPKKLEKQIKKFEENSTLGLVSCNAIISNKGKEKLQKLKVYNNIKDLLINPSKIAFSNSSVVIPRSVIKEVGERDENLKIFEDHDMFLRIALAGYSIDFVDEPLLKYNLHETNLSKRSKKKSNDYERFLCKHDGLLRTYPEIYATHLKSLANISLMVGNIEIAKKAFKKSIKLNPNIKHVAASTFSILLRKIYVIVFGYK